MTAIIILELLPALLFFVLIAINKVRGIPLYWYIDGLCFYWLPVFIIWGVLNLLYASPSFWLHDDGITVKLPFRDVFVRWDEITKITVGLAQTNVFFRRLSLPNGCIGFMVGSFFLFRSAIVIWRWQENHALFIEMAQEKIPKKVVGGSN